MGIDRHQARFDWAAEAVGAGALAVGVGYSALKAAPAVGWDPLGAAALAAVAGLLLGLGAMRAIRSGARTHPLAGFAAATNPFPAVDDGRSEDDALLLDTVWAAGDAESAMLLDDRLPEAELDSRVVRLFASAAPTAGELSRHIERHLAGERVVPLPVPFASPAQPPDASAALFAALDELRRSLR